MAVHVHIEAIDGIVHRVEAETLMYETVVMVNPMTGSMVALSNSTQIPGPRTTIYERSMCLHLDVDGNTGRCRRCGVEQR